MADWVSRGGEFCLRTWDRPAGRSTLQCMCWDIPASAANLAGTSVWFSRRRIARGEGGTEMTTKSRPLTRAFALALVLALPLLVVHAQRASPFRIGFLCVNDAGPVDEALRDSGCGTQWLC